MMADNERPCVDRHGSGFVCSQCDDRCEEEVDDDE